MKDISQFRSQPLNSINKNKKMDSNCKINKPLNKKISGKMKESDEIDMFLNRFINRAKETNKNHIQAGI